MISSLGLKILDALSRYQSFLENWGKEVKLLRNCGIHGCKPNGLVARFLLRNFKWEITSLQETHQSLGFHCASHPCLPRFCPTATLHKCHASIKGSNAVWPARNAWPCRAWLQNSFKIRVLRLWHLSALFPRWCHLRSPFLPKPSWNWHMWYVSVRYCIWAWHSDGMKYSMGGDFLALTFVLRSPCPFVWVFDQRRVANPYLGATKPVPHIRSQRLLFEFEMVQNSELELHCALVHEVDLAPQFQQSRAVMRTAFNGQHCLPNSFRPFEASLSINRI